MKENIKISQFVIGITGGIGSGKTSVTDSFAKLGIDVIDTDILSREALSKGSALLPKVFNYFGEGFKLSDGSLNRTALREEIFTQPASKLWLEKLVHPWVKEQTLIRLAAATSPYVILVSPLLIEAGQMNLINRLAVVDLNREQQLERTSARDNSSRELVDQIMQQQLERNERLSFADDVIDNSKDLAFLNKQVEELHAKYLQLATTH